MPQHSFSFSQSQMHKLRKGGSVRLTHEQITGGSHKLEVHPSLYKKIHKALREHKGIVVHSPLVGGGFLDSLKDAGRWLGEKALPSLGRIAERVLVPKLEKAGEDLARKGLARLGMGHHKRTGGRLPPPVPITSGYPTGSLGLGVKKRHHHLRGGAWYDDLWDGVKSLGSKAADVAIPLAINYGSKALLGLGHKRKHHRAHHGKGLYPGGYGGHGLQAPGY